MHSYDKNLLRTKTKRSKSYPNSHSIGSDNIIFSNKNNKSYTIKHISNYHDFILNFNNIRNPCYTTDNNYFSKMHLSEKLKDTNNIDKIISYPVSIDTIDKTKIISIDDPKNYYKNIKSSLYTKFIFSNPEDIDEQREENIFQNIHNYCNGYFDECYITDFCPDASLHFPKNNDKIFYQINRYDFFVESFKVFHYNDFGIGHFYSPKGSGKSILFRSILMNFSYLKDEKRLTPLMFFNIKLLFDLLDKAQKEQLVKIILHESYSLFYDRKEQAKDLLKKINFNTKNVMDLIYDIIKNVVNSISFTFNGKQLELKHLLFILDGYSCIYDTNNKLSDIIKLVHEKQNFFVEIIYDVINGKDSEKLFYNLSPKNYINYDTYFAERYFYFEELKKISDIAKCLDINDIPGNYKETFGENVSYYFEYKKSGLDFIDFINEKKIEIKNEILLFYNSVPKFQFQSITNIVGKNLKLKYDEILKYIPANYIKIIIEPKPVKDSYGTDYKNYDSNKTYNLDYSFPLVKTIILDILSDEGFINMKHKDFLNLTPQALGISFDIEMNRIFLKLIKDRNPFFNHTKKTFVFVDNILEKLEKNNKKQIYKKVDVINKIKNMSEIKEFKEKNKDINYNDFTFIGVFQNEFQGKAFDILFLLKENSDDTSFKMILLQIKVSDTYKEDKDIIISEQAEYVKQKFCYLLGVSINQMYLSYLSIYQKPKKFANDNKSRTFLYDIINDKFVDFHQKEYNNFPILQDSIVDNPDEKVILQIIKDDLINSCNKEFLLIEKNKNISEFNNKNLDEIEKLLNNEIYISVSKNVFKYYYKFGDVFGHYYKKANNIFEVSFEKIFEISIKSN